MGKKTTNIYEQKPVCIGYYIVSESTDILQSGLYELPLGYDNVNLCVDEVIKSEKN